MQAEDGGEVTVDEGADRDNRAAIEFGLDENQAGQLHVLVAAAESVPDDLASVVAALGDDAVAEAAWLQWGDEDLLGASLDVLVDRLADVDDPNTGVVWVRARHHAYFGRTDDAITLLEAERVEGNRLVLMELASIEADRSEPLAARRLLELAGVTVDVDLDSEYDPRSAEAGFGPELAEEIAPFAALRPKPMAGRNERCPCGSGKKYKQCHLGNELHPLTDRAGWLYVKMLRFLQVNNPNLPGDIADGILDAVADPELRSMMHASYLPVDLALFEGGVAEWFLEAKASLLPADEFDLLRSWIDVTRSVLDVVSSRSTSMEVVDLATRARQIVVVTLPDEPLDTGWKIIGRLVPVGDDHRAYGGFLPINDDMVDGMLAAFATHDLETTVLAIGQIFETAVTHDEISDLFADSIDTSGLTALLQEFGDDSPPDVDRLS